MGTVTKPSQVLAVYKCREHFTTELEEKARRKAPRKRQLHTAEMTQKNTSSGFGEDKLYDENKR